MLKKACNYRTLVANLNVYCLINQECSQWHVNMSLSKLNLEELKLASGLEAHLHET